MRLWAAPVGSGSAPTSARMLQALRATVPGTYMTYRGARSSRTQRVAPCNRALVDRSIAIARHRCMRLARSMPLLAVNERRGNRAKTDGLLDPPTCRVPSFLAKAAVGEGLQNALQVLQDDRKDSRIPHTHTSHPVQGGHDAIRESSPAQYDFAFETPHASVRSAGERLSIPELTRGHAVVGQSPDP